MGRQEDEDKRQAEVGIIALAAAFAAGLVILSLIAACLGKLNP